MKNPIKFLSSEKSVFYFKILILIVTTALIVWMFPNALQFNYVYYKGTPWLYGDMIAKNDFPILKSDSVLRMDREEAVKNLRVYLRYDQELTDRKKGGFRQYFDMRWKDMIMNENYSYEKSIDEAERLYDLILKRGVLRKSKELQHLSDFSKVVLVNDNAARVYILGDFLTVNTIEPFVKTHLDRISSTDEELANQIILTVLKELSTANVRYDEKKNIEEIDKAIESVSLTKGMVQRGERFISKGEVVSAEKYQVLLSFEKDFKSKIQTSISAIWIKVGQGLVIIALMLILVLYFFYHNIKSLSYDFKRILFINLVVLFIVWLTSMAVSTSEKFVYIIPVCIIPLIIHLFVNMRAAMLIHVITVVIISFLVPDSFDFLVLNIVSGMIALLAIKKLNTRAQFFLYSLTVFVTYSLVYTGLFLMKEGNFSGLDYKTYIYFCVNGLLTLFSYPLVYMIEKGFKMVTDITLLELCDANKPLLRELMLKAPGTFQHSLQVSNISEAAVREIGGNTLLAKAAALYHDIGKMNMAGYFIENQRGERNPHDDLSCEESAKILISHVTQGMEIGKKYRLPDTILDFIWTHHGNRRTDFFYFKFKKEFPDIEVNEDDFTYPGTKPFSKEMAVLMMVDSCEAASKSLTAPTQESVSELVDKIIDKQLEEGQFDDANITFKDLKKIRQVIKAQLMNINHVRISYPDSK